MLINDAHVVKDLIEKRSLTYSARPDWFIRDFNNNMNIAFREYAFFRSAAMLILMAAQQRSRVAKDEEDLSPSFERYSVKQVPVLPGLSSPLSNRINTS